MNSTGVLVRTDHVFPVGSYSYEHIQGPRSKFSSRGAEEECVKDFCFGQGGGGGHVCGFLFNFSKVTENAIITIKLLIFFPQLQ